MLESARTVRSTSISSINRGYLIQNYAGFIYLHFIVYMIGGLSIAYQTKIDTRL